MVTLPRPDDSPSSMLVIGCGNMGAAMIRAAEAAFPTTKVVALDPDPAKARRLLPAATSTRLLAEAAELADEIFEVAIVAVKPQHVHASLVQAGRNLKGALIISIAAGVSLSALSQAAPPNARTLRAMPNLPATVQAAMTLGCCGERRISERDRRTVARIFEAMGRFRWLKSEDEIDAATAISGSGPGYVFAFAEQLANSAVMLGLPDELAQELARQTVVGAARMLEADPRSASELKRAVTSPGGTTAAALSVLERDEGLPKCLPEAALAALGRARELATINGSDQ